MVQFPMSPKKIANGWQTISTWLSRKTSTASRRSRKTEVINDPLVHIQNARASGINPYTQLRQRSASLKRTPDKGATCDTGDHNPSDSQQLRSDLLTTAKQLQLSAYRSGNLEKMVACNRFINQVSKENWPDIKSSLQPGTPLSRETVLRPFLNRINQLTPDSVPTTNPSPPVTPETTARSGSHRQRISVTTKDILTVNNAEHQQVGTIVCPHSEGEGAPTQPAVRRQLIKNEPRLGSPRLNSALAKMKIGNAALTNAGRLSKYGFLSVIHTRVPAINHHKSRPEAAIIRAYIAVIQAAQLKKVPAITTPILGDELDITPERLANIALLAIKRCTDHNNTGEQLPHILFSASDNERGQRFQRHLLKAMGKEPSAG